MTQITTKQDIRPAIEKNGYSWIPASEFVLSSDLELDRQQFWADWDNLEPDKYLKDGARFRSRRYGRFYFLPDQEILAPLPHEPYFQTPEDNDYVGGIHREFASLLSATQSNRFLHELIRFNFRHLPVSAEKRSSSWEVGIHQVRITATAQEQGEPTPEGVHHDGNDFFAVYLIGRENASGGISTIYDNDVNPLESQTLARPMDAILVQDPRVMHGVTPIEPRDPDRPATRDVLVVDYFDKPELENPAEILDLNIHYWVQEALEFV